MKKPKELTKPTRRNAERVLAKARKQVAKIMKSELDSERIDSDVMNFRMR